MDEPASGANPPRIAEARPGDDLAHRLPAEDGCLADQGRGARFEIGVDAAGKCAAVVDDRLLWQPGDVAAARYVQPRRYRRLALRRRMPRPVSDAGQDAALPPLPLAVGVVVDDLEIVQVDQRDLERAIQENGDHETAAVRNLGAWMPYALLSGLGLVGLIAGVERFISQAARPVLRGSDIYAGPVLALGGGFLFLIASYYLYRAMTRQD